jgi:hypothetical protein
MATICCHQTAVATTWANDGGQGAAPPRNADVHPDHAGQDIQNFKTKEVDKIVVPPYPLITAGRPLSAAV